MHLTDDQLNEFLDNETSGHAEIEAHLSSCDECATRLATLRNLFAEIESLPDIVLSRDLAAPFKHESNLPVPQFPRWLTLTATLQAAVATIAIIVTAPLVMDLVSPYISTMQAPSFAEIFLQLQFQWMAWLDTFSRLQIPALPEIPVINVSSLIVIAALAGISALWLIGNGLLLRNQVK